MKCTLLALILAVFSASVSAAPPPLPAAGGATKMLDEMKVELEAGAKQLAGIREKIDADRLPLSKQLDALEEELRTTRKGYDEVARTLDTRNLDITNLTQEVKAKEDEAFYVSNLLDEFVRGFETKVHMSELPRLKPGIEKAKSAAADTAMATADRFAAQIVPLRAALARSKEALGGMPVEGKALNDEGTLLEGKFLLVGPFALFASKDGTATGIVPPTKPTDVAPLVMKLDETFNAGITQILASGQGIFPLDATNGNALKELLHKTSLIDTYKHGGPIMHPLLLVSIVAFGVVIERLIFLVLEKKRRKESIVEQMLDACEKDELDRAVKIGRSTKDFVAKVLLYALEHREKSIGSALGLAANKELKRLARGLPILDTCITLAPLLGLLGTVTGMMHSFSLMGGDLGAPGAITGGISEALIATAYGLVIAIVAVIPYNYLNARVDDARHQIEAAATRMELLMKKAGAPDDLGGGFKLAAPAASGGGGVH